MTSDSISSKTISILRFPLTVGVVFIHFTMTNGFNYHGDVYGLDNPPFFFFVVNLFSEVIARVCVPLFFVISGFLFFYNCNLNREAYFKKLRSRVKTLLLPFVMWNIIAAMVILGKSVLPFYPNVTILFSFNRLFNTFFYNIDGNGIVVGPSFLVPSVASPLDIPLWFVRDLMMMVLLAPVHYWFIKATRGAYIITLGLLWFFSPFFFLPSSYIGLLIMASFFFSLGGFFGIRKIDLVISFRNYKFAPFLYLIVIIGDALTKNYEYNDYIHKIGIVLGIISFVLIASFLLEYSKVNLSGTLCGSSFFVFSLHTLFMGDLGKIVFRLFRFPGDNPWIMLMIYFTVPLLTVFICYFLSILLKTYMPRLFALLVGNR